MKLGLVGGSYQERSLPFDAQRSVNLFPVLDETRQGKEVSALYGTPGLNTFCTIPDSPIRAEFASATGRVFAVAGVGLYEIDSGGTATYRGAVNSSSGVCTIAENFTQLVVCDGTDLYVLTLATNAFAQVTDVDLPDIATITFQDGYIIGNKVDTGSFYYSALNDATNWDSLDFATAESSPDDLVRVYSAYGQLWLLGSVTTEVWYNSGDIDLPFARIDGAKMQQGCLAPYSVADMDNSLFWLGADKDGRGIVYRTNGYQAQRVSTFPIELRIREATDIENIRAYTYQEDGHLFYVLTDGGLETSLVYDAATGLWHERAALDGFGQFTLHKAATHCFGFGKHLVGDRTSGVIYEMSMDYYDDAGEEIRRERTFTHVYNEGKRLTIDEIQVDFEYGVGLTTGQGSNPIAIFQTSDTGGRTWSPEYEASIGAIGAYNAQAIWRRLGQFEQFTGRIAITDPVKVAICGAYMQGKYER